jgi:hypothetical protein
VIYSDTTTIPNTCVASLIRRHIPFASQAHIGVESGFALIS